MQREHILAQTLAHAFYNQSLAAKLLGIDRAASPGRSSNTGSRFHLLIGEGHEKPRAMPTSCRA